jgi:hypothetical protein
MQLTRHSSNYREIDWEQLRLVNHFRLMDFAGQVQPTFRDEATPVSEILGLHLIPWPAPPSLPKATKSQDGLTCFVRPASCVQTRWTVSGVSGSERSKREHSHPPTFIKRPAKLRFPRRIGYIPSSPAGPPPVPLSHIPPCFIASP